MRLTERFTNRTQMVSDEFHVQSHATGTLFENRIAGNNLGSAVEGTLDYAGNPRVQGSNFDIGAYEQ